MTDDNQQTPEPTKPGWRERTLGMRGVAAVALASLILGGAGGAAVGVVASGDDDEAWRPPGNFERQGPPDRGRGGPPAMAPQDDVQPDSGGDNSSSGDTT